MGFIIYRHVEDNKTEYQKFSDGSIQHIKTAVAAQHIVNRLNANSDPKWEFYNSEPACVGCGFEHDGSPYLRAKQTRRRTNATT